MAGHWAGPRPGLHHPWEKTPIPGEGGCCVWGSGVPSPTFTGHWLQGSGGEPLRGGEAVSAVTGRHRTGDHRWEGARLLDVRSQDTGVCTRHTASYTLCVWGGASVGNLQVYKPPQFGDPATMTRLLQADRPRGDPAWTVSPRPGCRSLEDGTDPTRQVKWPKPVLPPCKCRADACSQAHGTRP